MATARSAKCDRPAVLSPRETNCETPVRSTRAADRRLHFRRTNARQRRNVPLHELGTDRSPRDIADDRDDALLRHRP